MTAAPLDGSRALDIRGRSIFYTLVLAVSILLVLCPLILLFVNSFFADRPDGTQALSLDQWRVAWSQPGIVQSLVNTGIRVLVTELITFPIGLIFAWLLARTDLPGKGFLDLLMWIAFFLPTLPVVTGWILLLDPDFGLVNRVLRGWFGVAEPPFDIYSFWGIVWIHVVTRSVAAKCILLTPAFRNLDASYEEASRICGVGAVGTLKSIVIPIMTPAVLITLIISLIHSLESFEAELILGPPFGFYVFSTKIYALIGQDPPHYGAATVLSIVILTSMLPLIWHQYYIGGRKNFTTVTSHFKGHVMPLGPAKWPAFVFVCAFGILITLVPAIFLIMGTFMNVFGFFDLDKVWTLGHWQTLLEDPTLIASLRNTLILAIGTAVLGVFWYAINAYIAVRTHYRFRGFLDFISWIPASIPGVILGLGLLSMFLGLAVLRPLYGTILILIVALAITGLTTGVQLIKGNMIQVGRELEEASEICGGSWLYNYRRIILPILTPALVSVGTLTFVTAARNVANIAMLVTSENRPLAMLQLDYMVDGSYEAASIVGILVVVMTAGVAIGARIFGNRFGIKA